MRNVNDQHVRMETSHTFRVLSRRHDNICNVESGSQGTESKDIGEPVSGEGAMSMQQGDFAWAWPVSTIFLHSLGT